MHSVLILGIYISVYLLCLLQVFAGAMCLCLLGFAHGPSHRQVYRTHGPQTQSVHQRIDRSRSWGMFCRLSLTAAITMRHKLGRSSWTTLWNGAPPTNESCTIAAALQQRQSNMEALRAHPVHCSPKHYAGIPSCLQRAKARICIRFSLSS